MNKFNLSSLPHTWLMDVDGTVFKHNSHLDGQDQFLPGVMEFWQNIPEEDVIVLLSARTEDARESTLASFRRFGLRYDHALFGLPFGERILVNDCKPRGLATAIAVNLPRDAGLAGIKFSLEQDS
jgi:hypothetical protein